MEKLSLIFNSVGLLFDIAGVILIYFFWIPKSIDTEKWTAVMIFKYDETEEDKKERKKYKVIGNLWLLLLILWFILQLISNFL